MEPDLPSLESAFDPPFDLPDFEVETASSTNRRGTKATRRINPVPHVKKGIESKSTDRRARRIL